MVQAQDRGVPQWQNPREVLRGTLPSCTHSPLRLLASVYPRQSSFFQPLCHTVWTYLWHQQGILLALAPGGELGLAILLSLPGGFKRDNGQDHSYWFTCKAL